MLVQGLMMWLGLAVAGITAGADHVLAPNVGGVRMHDGTILRQTIYLNFGGGPLHFPLDRFLFDDNAALDTSFLVPEGGVVWPPYAGGEQTALAVVEAVQADFSMFGVRIVYLERPPARLPYTMVMVGGEPELIDTKLTYGGVAPIDCEATNLRRVAFVFNDEDPVLEQANLVSHEIGHTFGLDHADGSDEIMSYEGLTADKEFTAECRPYCIEGCGQAPPRCTDRHEEYCEPGTQNAAAELLHFFGENEPDLQPPAVTFLTPLEGDVLALGEDLSIDVEIDDDFGNVGWELRLERDGEVLYQEPDFTGIPTWYFLEPDAGTYTITVIAEDHADHVTEESVTIEVIDPEMEHAETTGGSSSGGDSSTGTDSDGSTSGEGTTASANTSDEGCGCRTTRKPRLGSLLPLWFMGIGRRRPKW